MKLSILVTTYNRPRLLQAGLDSLLAQTDDRWEALIANDNSSNPEVEPIIRKFQEARPGTFYYKSDVSERERPTRTRFAVLINLLAEHATGDLMFYLCDDNELFPKAVETILAHFEAYPDQNAGYIGQAISTYDTRTGQRQGNQFDIRGNIAYGLPLPTGFCVVDHSQVVHRRQYFEAWPDGPEHWANADGVFFDKLIKRAGPLYPIGNVTREPLDLYKITDTSVCRQDINLALGKLRQLDTTGA